MPVVVISSSTLTIIITVIIIQRELILHIPLPIPIPTLTIIPTPNLPPLPPRLATTTGQLNPLPLPSPPLPLPNPLQPPLKLPPQSQQLPPLRLPSMLRHPSGLVLINLNLNILHRLVEFLALVLAEPCQRTADEAERFPCSGRGFEDADFALFDAVVDGLHEGLLDLVGLEGVVEVFGRHFFWVAGEGVTFILFACWV